MEREPNPPVRHVERTLGKSVEHDFGTDQSTVYAARHREIAVGELNAVKFRTLLVEPQRSLDLDDPPPLAGAKRDAEFGHAPDGRPLQAETVSRAELLREKDVRVERAVLRRVRHLDDETGLHELIGGHALEGRKRPVPIHATRRLADREGPGLEDALPAREGEPQLAPLLGPHRGLQCLAQLFPGRRQRMPLARIVVAGSAHLHAEVAEPNGSWRDFDRDRKDLPRRECVGRGQPGGVADALHAEPVLARAGCREREDALDRREVGPHRLARTVHQADEGAGDERAAIRLAHRAPDRLRGGGRRAPQAGDGHRAPDPSGVHHACWTPRGGRNVTRAGRGRSARAQSARRNATSVFGAWMTTCCFPSCM